MPSLSPPGKNTVKIDGLLRSNPSSGNLHPTEGYLILGEGPDHSLTPGVYHYAPKEHGLEQRLACSKEEAQNVLKDFPSGSFLVGLTSIHWREAWKYGERAFRYCQHDTGHAIGTLRIAAATLGWRLTVLTGTLTIRYPNCWAFIVKMIF